MFARKQKDRQAAQKARARRKLQMGEKLEAKQLMAGDAVIAYNAATDTVEITGSDYADTVSISIDNKGTASNLDDTLEVSVKYDKLPHIPIWGNVNKTFSQPLKQFVLKPGFPPSFEWVDMVDKIEFRGGTGNDKMTNNTNIRVEAFGDAGNDTLIGGSAGDMLSGGTGNDSLNGAGGNDSVWGRGGNDIVNGGSGNDVVHGDVGDDTVNGGSGNDHVYGDDGDDVVRGGTGNDKVYGEDGNDKLYGNDGEDSLFGGIGEDRLDGGDDGDVDELTGGPGVYTDAFHKESHLVFNGPLAKVENREVFHDFHQWNDIDEADPLFGPVVTALHTMPHEIGDVNADGVTDLNDFNTLKNNFGEAGERNDGDLTGDGKVNLHDFNVLKSHFGEDGRLRLQPVRDRAFASGD